MTTAAHSSVRDDVRLWCAAIATLAIVLQTLLVGFVDPDAMAATMDHSVIVGGAGDQGAHHQSDKVPSCPFCYVCCAGVVTIDTPAASAAVLPNLDFATIAPWRGGSVARRQPAHATGHSARGPPQAA